MNGFLHFRRQPACFSIAPMILTACVAGCAADGTVPTTEDTSTIPPGFDDHTVPSFASEADFLDHADLGEHPVQCKFTITRFQEGSGEVHFYEPTFYELHDEWYWFRLLNGQPVDGATEEPSVGLSFASIAEIYAEYRGKDEIPYDLKWFGERLASNRFYDQSLGRCKDGEGKAIACARTMGVGSVLYLPPKEGRVVPDTIWAVELEYVDVPTEALLLQFFARLEPMLPPEAQGGKLRWLARTAPVHEALAAQLRAGNGPLKDRVVTYSDLVTPGEVRGYNPGIRAGYVRRIRSGELSKSALDPNDIVVLEDVPDDLPPVAGIITAVPQTPQAHFNLLAAARGTPNGYVGGVMTDASLVALEADHTPIILKVTEDSVIWQPMSRTEWAEWEKKIGSHAQELVPADLEGVPETRPLDEGSLADMRPLLPTIGGKSAGLMGLVSFPDVPGPYAPIAVTVRGYAEHFASFEPTVKKLLENSEFNGDARVRLLLLEGEAGFRNEQANDLEALTWADGFLAGAHAQVIWDVLHGGGVQGMIISKPIDPAYLERLETVLSSRFAALSETQGLRFRSSSTAEDVDGFNGAGVYTSETAFLNPEVQTKLSDRNNTVERAVKLVWASFWWFGAFEERRIAGLKHLNGRMGITVHPRFDDDLEAANGVLLVGLTRAEGEERLTLTVNVQAGALSVTNPPPGSGITPEIDVVERTTNGDVVKRVQGSSEAEGTILTETELTWLMDRVAPVAGGWLDAQNALWNPAQQAKSVTLDFEFRKVHPGWPALAEGAPMPGRIVLKQVRPLSRTGSITDEALNGVLLPRDVLAAALRVDRKTCTVGPMSVATTDVTTDPLATLLPWSKTPFAAEVRVTFQTGLATYEIPKGTVYLLNHATAALSHPDTEGGAWSLRAEVDGFPWDALDLVDGGDWRLWSGTTAVKGTNATCVTVQVVQTPESWLESLLD